MKLNWGYSIFIVLVIFISLGIVFIVFSFRQNNDLVTEDYYEKGADYTHQMEITRRSAIYTDSIRFTDRNHQLVALFSKSINQMADTMHIYFYRPSDKKFDYQFRGLLNSDSLIIKKDNLINGRYKVIFQWFYSQNSYQVEKEFFIE